MRDSLLLRPGLAPAALLLALAPAAQELPYRFAARQTFVGDVPAAHAVGDWDGDGWPDAVALTHAQPGGARTDAVVFLRNDHGNLNRVDPRSDPGGVPLSVLSRDFDGDGRDDALIGLEEPDGSGCLLLYRAPLEPGAEPLRFELPLVPHAFAFGDVHGDGAEDLVVADAGLRRVQVFEAWRSTDLRPGAHYDTISSPQLLFVEDLDGDGKDEVLYHRIGQSSFQFLRFEDGVRKTIVDLAVGAEDLDVVDLDTDGLPEVVTSGDLVQVHRWQGGRFELQSSVSPAFEATWGAAGDLTGDGHLDVFVTGHLNAVNIQVQVLAGDGAGGLSVGPTLPYYCAPLDPHLADLNRDGRLDVLGCEFRPASLTVLRGRGGGALELATLHGSDHGRDLELFDFDRDGRNEVVGSRGFEDDLTVWSGSVATGFTVVKRLPIGRQPTFLTLGDFDGNGRIDVAAVAQDGDYVEAWRGSPALDFPSLGSAPFVFPFSVESADLDGDGRAEAVVGGIGRILVWSPATGDQATHGMPGSVGDIALADLDGDGLLDLLTDHAMEPVRLGRGNGDGTFGASTVVTSTPSSYVTPVDLDLDGHLDLAFGAATFGASDLWTALGDGAGAFGTFQLVASGDELSKARVSDLDGDGRPELVVSDLCRVQVIATAGTSLLRPNETFQIPWVATGRHGVQVGDLSGDGRPDIVTMPFSVSPQLGTDVLPAGSGQTRARRERGTRIRPALLRR